MLKDDNQLLKEFATGFAAIPEAKERFLKAARECDGGLSKLYSAVIEAIVNINAVMILDDKIDHIDCYRSGRLAALIRRFTYEMRAEGINIKIGLMRIESLVDAIDYYNSVDQEFAEVVSKTVCPDMDFNKLEQLAAEHLYDDILNPLAAPYIHAKKVNPQMDWYSYNARRILGKTVTFRRPSPFLTNEENTMNAFERFANEAVAKPTLIFGRLTEDMTDDDYLSAIRRLNSEIKALDDIKGSIKVKAKVKELTKQLVEVTGLYDDSDA